MEQPPEQIQSELENFREQWRAEVSARSKNTAGEPSRRHQQGQAGPSSASTSRAPPRRLDTSHRKAPYKALADVVEEEDYVPTRSFDDEPGKSKDTSQQEDGSTAGGEKEPQTALEYYEKAVDQETTGKLGDSLQLYRKAYRLDNHVDKAYREKHFPGQWKKKPVGQPNPSDASATVPSTAHHSLEGSAPLSLPELIASFAGLSVQGAPPEVEGMPTPPCPIADLPDEILVHILRDLAVLDIGDFVRLSQVCKRFAYLVVTENQIWRRVCIGSEFGFGAMIRYWQKGVSWEDLNVEHVLDEDAFTMNELQQQRVDESEATTNALFKSRYSSSWQRMFRQRPRIRFNGCYISTVNYIRTGHASGNSITWNSPVHIVT
jgi:F-box protein 9